MTIKKISILVFYLFICHCGLNAQVDSCVTNTFQKTYGRADIYDFGGDIVETTDHGFITAGYGGTNNDCFLMKIDKKGGLVWVKQITNSTASSGFMKRIIRLRNGNYVAMGRANKPDFEDTWVIKFDENGDIIWNKELTDPGAIGNDSYDICETDDEGLAIAGSYSPYANAGAFLIFKLDVNGNYVWGKGYTGETFFNGIIEKNGFLYVAGIDDSKNGLVAKIQSSDGTILAANSIRVDNKNTLFYGIANKNDKLYIDGYNTNSNNQGITQVILILDSSFNVQRVHKFDLGFNNSWDVPGMFPTSDGGYVTTESNDSQISDLLLIKVSYDGVIQWKRQYTRNGDQRTFIIKETTDKGIIGVGISNDIGYYNSNANDVFIFKTDSLGLTPDCPFINPYAVISVPSLTNYSTSVISSSLIFPVITISSLDIPVTIPVNTFCEKEVVPTCNKIDIAGTDSVCNISNTISYMALRNQNCNSPVAWKIDTAFATAISSTDSTINLKFKKTGYVKIYASIASTCENIIDSLEIYIFNSPVKLDLGPDSSVCKNGSYILHAGPGFKSYIWQDGSVDSNFTISIPGLYYASAINACGNVFTDSVFIKAALTPLLNIGNDTSICNGDTLMLNATTGFASYSWSPDYRISSLSGNMVRIFPNTDTIYRVSATNSTGCTATGSVAIKVNKFLPVDLGSDTSFCNGNSLVLNSAGSGFESYSWNTGDKSQQITVSVSGLYIIKATDANSCTSADTIVITIHKNPTLHLPKDSVICMDVNLVLNAGDGFVNYVWQDGSVNQIFLVSGIGKYWVSVIDSNSCKGSDTTDIKSVAPAPSNFLNKNTSICEGEKTILTANTDFDSYLWSTGDKTKQTGITSAGIYWLQVTNNYGCSAKEFTNAIAKTGCINAIYFPNVFTPNQDGINDIYKARVYGTVSTFHLIIYNRFGQKVFESYDYNKGWDGKFKNVQFDSGTFAWFSEYRLANGISKTQKGILNLLK